MNTAEQLKGIEQNHLGHFSFLPQELGFDLYNSNGVIIIDCQLGSSMFNIAYGAPLTGFTEEYIITVIKAFKGQPFAWWIPPSQHNPQLTEALLNAGFITEAVEHAMICNLTNTYLPEQKTGILIKPVTDVTGLQDFIGVLEPYDHSVRAFYEMMKYKHISSNEKLFVGYVDNHPVTIAILYTSNMTAGIFTLLTKDNAQGKGYGTDMMRFLLKTAKGSDCKYVTLSASGDSGYRIYKRLGFQALGRFECFEYKSLS